MSRSFILDVEHEDQEYAIDKLHHDFVEMLDALSCMPDREFPIGFRNLVTAAEHVFRVEEQWLEANHMHAVQIQEENARVLGALHNVHFRVMNGELGLGREVVEELLPQWFPLHKLNLDAFSAMPSHAENGDITQDHLHFAALNFPATRH